MSFRNLIGIIILAIVLAAAVASEGYFYSYSEKQNDSTEAVIQSLQKSLKTKQSPNALAQAQIDLQAQTERLKEMETIFPSSPVLDAAIETDVSEAAAAGVEADSLAADPKLDIPAQATIIILGQKATQALSYLQYLEGTSASTYALNDAAENAIELVAAYVNELYAYLDSLTPSNSGLSAGEIASYQAEADDIVKKVDSAENSLNQADDIPADSVPDITSTSSILAFAAPPAGSNPSNPQSSPDGTPTSTGASASNDNPGQGQSPDQTGASDDSVTLGDIADQQNVVSQDTDEVNQLADQAGSETASSSDSSDNSSSGSPSSSDNGDSGDNGSGSIQSQGGPVKLIQGENDF